MRGRERYAIIMRVAVVAQGDVTVACLLKTNYVFSLTPELSHSCHDDAFRFGIRIYLKKKKKKRFYFFFGFIYFLFVFFCFLTRWNKLRAIMRLKEITRGTDKKKKANERH